MSIKYLGGIISGMCIGGGITYAILNKKIKNMSENNSDMVRLIKDFENKISEINNDHDNYQIDSADKISILEKSCHNAKMVCEQVSNSYKELLNPDMLADITIMDDVDHIDECLSAIEKATKSIHNLSTSINFDCISNTTCKTFINDTNDIMGITTDIISKSIKTYQDNFMNNDDDDEDDDEELKLVSPKRVIINSIRGTSKIFEAEPDDGFEIIDGSDPDNNDYCIDSKNIPALYNFLFASVVDQLSCHYVAEIDKETFNTLIEDMVITVSLSFINETDVVITAVNAAVPFELFGESIDNNKYNIYTIHGGELELANVMDYFRSGCDSNNNKTSQNDSTKNSSITETENKKEEKKVVKTNYDKVSIAFDSAISDDAVQFIVDTIGYNRESLVAFIGKLKILMKANPEAGEAIYNAYNAIFEEVQILIHDEKLTEEDIARCYNSIRAIYSNMKKNYSASIKSYKQTEREKVKNSIE